MPTLINGAAEVTITKQNNTNIHIPTNETYVDTDIDITLNVQSATSSANTATANVTKVVVPGTAGGINTPDLLGTKTTSEPSTGHYVLMRANATGSSKIDSAGWIDTGALQTASAMTDYYYPINEATMAFSGGDLSKTDYSKNDLACTLQDGSSTNMANITFGAQDTTNYPYYFKVDGSTPAVEGNTNVNRAVVTYSNNLGMLDTHSSENALAAGSISPSVSVNATSASGYVGIKEAEVSISGTNSVTPSVTTIGTNVILDDTNNGVYITATGGGTANADLTAAASVAGYAPLNTNVGTGVISSSSTLTTETKFISGVNIPSSPSRTNVFTATVPNGSGTQTVTFSVDSNGNVTIT